ncbi:MAG: hypothetical protein Q4G24_03710 [Paracoccus sp. (in: a-proteobacteria)]|uniref:hypothetical protein n=1 Tax=Paracoccus sp. TaxID=267 RepID=UPI0026DFD196|nr:hypothetical protein [Paracoccus sp. (in: a-proteobacteria)]MDO5620556.1 hypothetical protein [Paracoccus sp. (in: a-proteobacteria)]
MADPRIATASELSENIGDVLAAIRRLIAEDEGAGQPRPMAETVPFPKSPTIPMPAAMTVAPVSEAIRPEAEARPALAAQPQGDSPAHPLGSLRRSMVRDFVPQPAAMPDPLVLDHTHLIAPQEVETVVPSAPLDPLSVQGGTTFMTSALRRPVSAMANPWADVKAPEIASLPEQVPAPAEVAAAPEVAAVMDLPGEETATLAPTGSVLRDLIREIMQDELRGDLGEVIAHEVERCVKIHFMRMRRPVLASGLRQTA